MNSSSVFLSYVSSTCLDDSEADSEDEEQPHQWKKRQQPDVEDEDNIMPLTPHNKSTHKEVEGIEPEKPTVPPTPRLTRRKKTGLAATGKEDQADLPAF
jgi:hypothetical protein